MSLVYIALETPDVLDTSRHAQSSRGDAPGELFLDFRISKNRLCLHKLKAAPLKMAVRMCNTTDEIRVTERKALSTLCR